MEGVRATLRGSDMSPQISGSLSSFSFHYIIFLGKQSKYLWSSVSSRQCLCLCLRLSVTLSVGLSAHLPQIRS